MILTKEQENIINAKEASFKINAVAGSGKTTTLLEYAKKNSNLNILYLAYNKSLQISLQEKLHEYNLNNMQISTIHALAYSKIQAYQYNLAHDLKAQVIERILCDFEEKINQRKGYYPIPEYIALIKDLVNFYCNSSLIALDSKLLDSYKKQSDLSAKILELINKDSSRVLAHLKHILSAMKNKQIDATHDFYLKMFYLNKKVSTNLGYDLILVDEAQDISDVMIGIVEAQNCRRIYVGDSFQQIYSFRYALNALNKIELPSYELTHSFRFSNTYAKTLERNLNTLYKINDTKPLNINGTENETKIGEEAIDFNKQFTVISRSTFGLVQEIVHYIQEDKKIYFEGGYGSYSFMNQTVYSIFYLKQKKNDRITLDEIKDFESIYELEQFAKDTKNQDYLNVIKFINAYGDNIFDINKKIKEKLTTKKEDADILFTTTHKSKGLEYDQVVMTNDFISKKEISNPKNNLSHLRINEELNIYYVAATRAKKAIDLSSLNLNYTYKEGDEATSHTKSKYTKKTSQKKMKNMQEEWLKKNRIKKVNAF
ncbi:UvrD-helicase domain-containing protein [Poseidonibacter lekithochrous]|uniref:UvrD-helicase domain-containing protein n=1 Tax=Poseidonibacter lekithochrous TaxID=1904463 RepID=UPI0008FC6183|nr:UvrD-helicase domain-containing protein [Poseidonibacter lekithochrous]QKJ22577.1 putative DNA helicase [Poseidonibacter lekithochrous]